MKVLLQSLPQGFLQLPSGLPLPACFFWRLESQSLPSPVCPNSKKKDDLLTTSPTICLYSGSFEHGAVRFQPSPGCNSKIPRGGVGVHGFFWYKWDFPDFPCLCFGFGVCLTAPPFAIWSNSTAGVDGWQISTLQIWWYNKVSHRTGCSLWALHDYVMSSLCFYIKM